MSLALGRLEHKNSQLMVTVRSGVGGWMDVLRCLWSLVGVPNAKEGKKDSKKN